MKLKAILAMAAMSAVLVGCSDGDAKVKEQFISGCTQGGATKEVCSCAFDKLTEKYTIEELKKIDAQSTPPAGFIEAVMDSAKACAPQQ